MITVPGRILGFPQVKYGSVPVDMQFVPSWNQTDSRRKAVHFSTGSTLNHWTAVMINMRGYGYAFRNPQELQSTMSSFKGHLNEVGITASNPLPPRIINMSGPHDSSLEDALREAREELLLVILPEKHIALYNRIKHIADTKAGLHTICVVGSKLSNPNPRQQGAYFANVALKFNLKLGGVNQKLDDARLGVIAEGKTMVVGIDVTHPSPGSAENAQSVAGMVASIDRQLGQWPAVLRLNGMREKRISEEVTNLDEMLRTRLKLWKERERTAICPRTS